MLVNRIAAAGGMFLALGAAPARADDLGPGSSLIGIQMNGNGEASKLMELKLMGGANAMLHGYAPQAGDVVEWYVVESDCVEPEKACRFELGVRKAK